MYYTGTCMESLYYNNYTCRNLYGMIYNYIYNTICKESLSCYITTCREQMYLQTICSYTKTVIQSQMFHSNLHDIACFYIVISISYCVCVCVRVCVCVCDCLCVICARFINSHIKAFSNYMSDIKY